jgi:hypothetical protein
MKYFFPLLNAFANLFRRSFGLVAGLVLFAGLAHSMDSSSPPQGTEGGVSAIWIFANLSFTGMRAQAKGSTFWKVVTFILGFPGTLLTLLVVTSGSERAYGIDLPRNSNGVRNQINS